MVRRGLHRTGMEGQDEARYGLASMGMVSNGQVCLGWVWEFNLI